MAYGRQGIGSGGWVLIIVIGLVIVALVLWWAGVFQSKPSDTREVYKAEVTDQSGGSFIVSDSGTPAVPVTVPTTKMHDVPATPSPSPNPSSGAK